MGREFFGSLPAMVTPFRDGAIDEPAMRGFIDWQIEAGTHGLVPCGTTGESATLSHSEHRRVIELTLEHVAGRVPVMAGCGSNATAEAVGLAKDAAAMGADALLVVTPYYNKPNQEGLLAHFRAVADATDRPLYIYNIPGRSVIDMTVETMATLAQHPNIVGVKDASGDPTRMSAQRHACGAGFIQLSGNDDQTLGLMAMGARGAISVTANVAPAMCAQFLDACIAGDFETAITINDRLFPLHKALFCSPSPGPAKYALAKLGHISGEVRLPILPPDPEACAQIDAALRHAGL
ncbi:MAG: 4-hydroxy-tetrahydrodipicolinate synthase [Pseudomonadota bacterium]